MSLLTRFKEFIRKENLFPPKEHLLLAVSGGVDSVVLTDLCYNAGYKFEIAHCNFLLRGAESERDKQFVVALADKYRVKIHVREFDTNNFASKYKLSIQEAARKLRYDWFAELVTADIPPQHSQKSQSQIKILTAHHADDNVETLLMNFFRGTGIKGLRGILPKKEALVRPLLVFTKEEITAYAIEHKLEWVEDSSNFSDKYSRNYFRQTIIPVVKKIFPETEKNLFGNLQRFREIEMLYRQSLDMQLQKLLEEKGSEIHIPVLKLKLSRPLSTIVYEIIGQYDFTAAQVDEVIALLDSGTGKYVLSSTHRILRNRKWLIITPTRSEQSQNILVESYDQQVSFEPGELSFSITTKDKHAISPANEIAQLDATNIELPLLLRKWKTGDYFYPLGMKKKKKLSRFFIDQKLSKSEKENVWVLEMDTKIIWVVGMRIDERCKVKDHSTDVLVITLKRQQLPK